MDRGFNNDLFAARSKILQLAAKIIRPDSYSRCSRIPRLPVEFHPWAAITTINPLTRRVTYQSISNSIKQTGFDVEGKVLDQMALPTVDYFQSAYESVLLWGDPTFGWESETNKYGAETAPIFEFALYPLGRDMQGDLIVLAFEDWFGTARDYVPPEFRISKNS